MEHSTGRRWSYAELNENVDSLARGMLAGGVKRRPGGYLGAQCGRVDYHPVRDGQGGGNLVNVNPAYRTHDYTYVINQSGLTWLFATTSFKTTDYREMIDRTRSDCPCLERVVVVDTDDWQDLVDSGTSLRTGVARRATSYPSAVRSPQHPVHLPERRVFRKERRSRIATSSITASPPRSFSGSQSRTGVHPRPLLPLLRDGDGESQLHLSRRLHGNPEPHLRSWSRPRMRGGREMRRPVRGPDDVHRRTESAGVRKHRPLLAADQSHGWVTMPDRGHETLRERDAHVRGRHSLRHDRDQPPVSCQTRIDDDSARRTATIGRVHPHLEINIVDTATGVTLPRGETGEFCTRGYSVMLGYWDDPQKTAEVVDEAGWMHAGDLAVMREDGYCNIVGRIKDMVIRGGENIYPREIEDFLYAHPDIEDVQVVGVPDPTYGEELCAWIKMKSGADPLDAAAIRDFSEGRLAGYKIPRYVTVVDEFPMTVTGKV